MRRNLLPAASLATILLLASSPVLFAQRTTGTISGVVKDASGAPLPGATASITGRTSSTQQT